jgi:spore germination cell wall hydrolase CwlJ-like protein
MKFRKLLLCLLLGITLTGFANIYTYAAEEDNIVTNDTTIQDTTDKTVQTTTADPTADVTTVNGNSDIINETAGTEPAADSVNKEAVTEDTAESSTKEDTTDEAEKEKAAQAEKIAAEKKAAEKEAAEKKAAEKKAAEKKAAEEAKKAAEAKKEEAKYSKADLRLLSALIYCEANGESYNGKLAVGIVVMNRVRSASFADTVKGVVYQKYQFGPASSGALSRALDQYDNGKFTSGLEKDCINAAKEALSGTTSIAVNGSKKNFTKYLYFSGSLRGNTFSLGNHEFK